MTVADSKYVTEGNLSGFLSERTDTKESTCILRAALNADGMTKCKDNCYELPSAFCQQLEMQMEEQALRVRAVRSGPRSCARAGLPCKGLKMQLSLNKYKIELTVRYPKYKDTKQKKPFKD